MGVVLVFYIIVFLLLIVLGSISFYKLRLQKKKKKSLEKSEICKKLPWDGNLIATYASLKELETLPTLQIRKLVNAYIVKWMLEEQIEIIWQPEIITGATIATLIQIHKPKMMDGIEKRLFDMLWAACNKDDFVLNSDAFREWCLAHWPEIRGWNQRAREEGYSFMQDVWAIPIKENKNGELYYNLHVPEYTQTGNVYIQEMYGYSNYLKSFSKVGFAKNEVERWKQDLVFAVVLGISKEFISQAESLDSQYFADFLKENEYLEMGFSMRKIVDDLWQFGFSLEQAYKEAEVWEYNTTRSRRY